MAPKQMSNAKAKQWPAVFFRGAWGRRQRAPIKELNHKDETEMRETPKNQELTGKLCSVSVFTQE